MLTMCIFAIEEKEMKGLRLLKTEFHFCFLNIAIFQILYGYAHMGGGVCFVRCTLLIHGHYR